MNAPFSKDSVKFVDETTNSFTQDFESDVKSQKNQVFDGQILLNPGISKANYYAAQVQQVLMVLTFTLADTLQPMILIDEDYYSVPRSQSGSINAKVLTYDLPTRIIFAPLYGALADHFGRRPLLIYGICSLFAGFLTAPLHEDVIPGYLSSRMLIINGAICILVLPFNADYVDDETKGRAAGIAYTFSSAGAVIASFFLVGLQQLDTELGDIYTILGTFILISGLINSIWIKGGKYHLDQRSTANLIQTNSTALNSDARPAESGLCTKLGEVFRSMKENKWIFVAMMLSLLGSADFYILTTIFVLYIKSFYPSTDEGQYFANQQATLMQGVFFTFAVIFCIVYGFLIDKMKQSKLLLSVLIGSAVSFLAFCYVSSPDDPLLYLAILVAGVSLPGIFTFASYLSYKHFSPEHRGILMGISAIFGVTGVVIVMVLGGYLFDTWSRNGPFLLYFMLISITAIIVALLKIFRQIDN